MGKIYKEDKKEKREREDREKDRQERRERSRSRSRLGLPDQGITGSYYPTFFNKVVHTFSHLISIMLLVLTLSSLAWGVSNLLQASFYEVKTLVDKGVLRVDPRDLALALFGFCGLLGIMGLTFLSAVLLVPALWVSMLEVMVCPWSVMADYFLP